MEALDPPAETAYLHTHDAALVANASRRIPGSGKSARTIKRLVGE
jgi:hypothetical protein